MPELPEVETVRRGLEPLLVGRTLIRVVARRPDLRFPLPVDFAQRLTGHQVIRLQRRSKYLLMHTSGPILLLHLGMSGRILIQPQQAAPARHDHLLFDTGAGVRLAFRDPRRFGIADFLRPDGGHALLDRLGPEPLGPAFTLAHLEAGLRGRVTAIKAALLDQTLVAGLGNIYVCEALFRAGLSPKRPAGTVPGRRAARLYPAIKQTLEDAIAQGGSSLRDYAQVDGTLGYFQHAFQVYGRAGEACRRCGSPVRRIVQSNRSSFYCGRCQR
ncbi:MAG: bifunctional DNA-formamidopyrimidine glycosylase/DNA-(apurinic or apyrimidinic site) lyase [Rhodothalassiaceae bacterium]